MTFCKHQAWVVLDTVRRRYGNLDNILEVKTRLGCLSRIISEAYCRYLRVKRCKSFAWFMNRFKHVYEELGDLRRGRLLHRHIGQDGGLIPAETFRIERDGGTRPQLLSLMAEKPGGPFLIRRPVPDLRGRCWAEGSDQARKQCLVFSWLFHSGRAQMARALR